MDRYKAPHPKSMSVDHIKAFRDTGQIAPPLDELRLVHFGCNSSKNARSSSSTRHRKSGAFPMVVDF